MFFLQQLTSDLSDFVLLLLNAFGGINYLQPELFHDPVIFLQNPALKETKTFHHILTQFQVHSCFVVFQLHSDAEKTLQGNLNWNLKIERPTRLDSKLIKHPYPKGMHTPNRISPEGCVGIAIGNDNHAGFQRWNDLVIEPISKIGRME